MKVCIMSDTHLHNWTQFSRINSEGVNSRLNVILYEMKRVAMVAKEQGCKRIVHCGDLFHMKQGEPTSVVVPTTEMFNYAFDDFDDFDLVAGNHDFEFVDCPRFGASTNLISDESAFTRTQNWDGINVGFIPWQNSVDGWKTALADEMEMYGSFKDGFIFTHCPIDGVIRGIPESGINQEYIESIGFEGTIFAGHYHNHKEVSKQLISVGALCHHTWSDVGSKAGYIILDTETGQWEFFPSKAPRFIDLDKNPSATIKGNYARITVEGSIEEAYEIKKELKAKGALEAVVNIKTPEIKSIREFTKSELEKNPLSLTLKNYIDSKYKDEDKTLLEDMQKEASDILSSVEEAL